MEIIKFIFRFQLSFLACFALTTEALIFSENPLIIYQSRRLKCPEDINLYYYTVQLFVVQFFSKPT